MALTTKASGTSRIRHAMGLAFKCGQMDQSMRASGRTTNKMARVDSYTLMATCMRATGEGTKLMARDSTSTSMDQPMKVSGATTSSMVTESSLIQMEQNMKANTYTERNTVQAHSSGLTTAVTKVKSKMTPCMERVCTSGLTIDLIQAAGPMAG